MTRRGRAACSSSPTLSPSDMGMGLHSIEWTCPECASAGRLFRTVDAELVSSDRERVNGHHLGAGGKGERVPDLFAAVESAPRGRSELVGR